MATKKQSVSILTDGGKLSALIKSIATRGKKLDSDLHQAAVSALWHGFEHKSTGYAETLLAAMPESGRKNALRAWLLDMGCFMLKEDNKTLGIDKVRHEEGFKLKADAESTPFWKYNKEPEVLSQVDAMDLVRKLVAKLAKAKEAGQLDAKGATVLDKLAKVAPALEVNGTSK